MPQHSLVDDWLDEWEESRRQRPGMTIEPFIAEVCVPLWEVLVRDFRRAVRDLDRIDRIIDAASVDGVSDGTAE